VSAGVTTMSFFRYAGLQKIWGMTQMTLAKKRIAAAEGLSFFKLLGSGGGNGFSLLPDFSAYALLATWDGLEAASNFVSSSEAFARFDDHATEVWTVYLRAFRSHGKWSGVEPFETVERAPDNPLVAVVTRASIARLRTGEFLTRVPAVSRSMDGADGLLFAKGVGELPWIEQATFSVWESDEAMRGYAYGNPQHKEVIRQTRERGWYTEELFARLQPFASVGTWAGEDPLGGRLGPPSAVYPPSS
jgi:hypothetical protein